MADPVSDQAPAAFPADFDPKKLLPSPPGIGNAAPAAVFAGGGVFTGFSPEAPGAKDPIPIVPWDHEDFSDEEEAEDDMDDFDGEEEPRQLFAEERHFEDMDEYEEAPRFSASDRHQEYLKQVQAEKQSKQQEELLRAKKEARRRKKKQEKLLVAAAARAANRDSIPPEPPVEEVVAEPVVQEEVDEAKEARVRETRRRQKQQYKRLMKTLSLKRRQDLASAEDDKTKEEEYKKKVRENGLKRARKRKEEALARRMELGDVVDEAAGSGAKAVSLLKQAEKNVLAKQNVLTDEDFLNAEEAKEALKRKRKEDARMRQERTRIELEKIASDKRAKVEAEQKKAQRLLNRQKLVRERVLNRVEPKEVNRGEDKENEPVARVAQKKPAEADEEKPVLTEEQKERRRARREAQETSLARLNKAPEKDKPTGAVGRDFKDYKRKLGLEKDTKVFCMTGWYPCVKDALLERGWHFNDDRDSTFYDLKWTLKSNDIDKSIKSNQLTNHFLKNTAITTKAGLTKSIAELHWHCDDHADHVYPRAHDLSTPHGFRAFLDDFRGLEAEKCLKAALRALVVGEDSVSSEEALDDTDATDAVEASDAAEAPTPAENIAEAPAPAESAVDAEDSLDSLEMDELDGVLGDAPAPLLFNEELLRIALRVCRKKLRVLVDDDAELDGGSGYADRLVTDLEWEALQHAQGRVDCSMSLPETMPPSLDTAFKLEEQPDEETDVRSSLDQAGSILARAREDKKARMHKAELLVRRKEARLKLMKTPQSLPEDLREEIEVVVRQLGLKDPQHQLNGGQESTRNTWIAKPAAKSRGRGIATFDDLHRLLDHCDARTGGSGAMWIVQKYMESQLLIAERKFDLRQWVLVTDWNPLTIYFYDECYARFTSHKFTDARESLDNPLIHLVNNSIQKDGKQFHEAVDAENGVPIEDCMWTQGDFADFLNWKMERTDASSPYLEKCKEASDVFKDVVQPEMQKIAVEVLQCARDSIEHRKKSWELYGYDFMVDGELRPWLIEVNSSPACDYSTKVTERYVKRALVDILKVTIDRREWERAPHGDEPDTGGWIPVHKGPFVETPIASLTGGDIFAEGKKVEAPRAIQRRARAAAKKLLAAKQLREERKRREVAERHAPRAAAPLTRDDDLAELDGFLGDDGATASVVVPPPRAAPVAAPRPPSPKQVAVPVVTYDPFAM